MKTNNFLFQRSFVVLWFPAFLGREGISTSWLGVDRIMWAGSFTAALQKCPQMLDLKKKNKKERKKFVSQWERFDQSFSGDGSLVAWQLACFLLRLIILPKALLSLNLRENTKEAKTTESMSHTLTGVCIAWRWLDNGCSWDRMRKRAAKKYS